MSSIPVRKQPIQGRGRGRVDQRGRGRDGEGGHCTPELTLPTSIPPHTYPSLDTSILPQTYPSPDTFIPLPTYTSPSIPLHTYISLPSPVSPESASMAIDITLSSSTLPLIDETMVDLVSELGALPVKRPRTPHIRRVLHPLAPSAPSAPFEIARDPIDQLVVYARCRPKRNIKAPSCKTH